jgi:hypothetical protein
LRAKIVTEVEKQGDFQMKKMMFSIACCLFLMVPFAAAQQSTAGNSRDLYFQYSPRPNHQQTGRPGARFWIERERNGKRDVVPSNTVFRSGDRVKFHFTVNYPAYVAVLNSGSTGRVQMLYPYTGTNLRVKPAVKQTVPKGEFWFKFDENPGEERLTFLMSAKPIGDVEQFAAKTANSRTKAAKGGSFSDDLEALADGYLAQSRDLNLDYVGNDGYALSTQQGVEKVKAFRFTLKHRR